MDVRSRAGGRNAAVRCEHVFALVHPTFGAGTPEVAQAMHAAIELRQLRDALAETRLLTLTGAVGAEVTLARGSATFGGPP
jgi:hypothetical protein